MYHVVTKCHLSVGHLWSRRGSNIWLVAQQCKSFIDRSDFTDDRMPRGQGGRGRGGRHGRGGRGRGAERRGDGSERHPQGLRGKEIGLWYARQNRTKKNKAQELERREVVTMHSDHITHIKQLLQEVQAAEEEEDMNGKLPDGRTFRGPRFDHIVKSFYRAKLERKAAMDENLAQDLEERKLFNEKYRDMFEFRKKLPAYDMRNKILDLVNNNQVVVISGETGCGKTTQVPQFILDDQIQKGRGSICRVVCTQPRRISAISVAQRVSAERGETCGGGSTGYQIRLEHRLPRLQGSILYCTTGILLKWMESDPLLETVSHVVLDEIHERDLLCDFLLIILKQALLGRPTLKIILMSATLNAEMFSEYFNNSPMLNIPGFTYPVTEYWIEDILQMTRYTPPRKQEKFVPKWVKYKNRNQVDEEEEKAEEEFQEKFKEYISSMRKSYPPSVVDALEYMDHEILDLDLAAVLIRYICLNKPDGAILVFLPGWDQISRLNELLTKQQMFNGSNYRILPLHSLMPTVNQQEIFERPPKGVRKIIISTNIAETSITVDDVVYVIDMGKVKVKNFDVKNNLETMKPEWVSKASARQRRGRSGRVQEGECFHVYTQLRASLMEEYQLPEMLRTPLEALCLHIKTLRLGKIVPFLDQALQQPDPRAIELAIETLKQISAMDADEELTPLGYHLSRLPVGPRIGKIILFGAIFSCLDPVLTIAASLDFKDPFVIPLGKEEQADQQRKVLSKGTRSDHMVLVHALEGWEEARRYGRYEENQFCWENFLSSSTLRMLNDMKGQFCELLNDIGFVNSKNPKHDEANQNSENCALIKAALMAGLYPKVVVVKRSGFRKDGTAKKAKIYTPNGGLVEVHPKSVNARAGDFPTRWMMYHQKVKSSSVFLHDTSPIDPFALLFFGGEISLMDDDGHETVCIDKDIRFHASFEEAKLVQDLRKALDRVLEEKIVNPGPTTWSDSTIEGKVMTAIVELLVHGEALAMNGGEDFYGGGYGPFMNEEENMDGEDDGYDGYYGGQGSMGGASGNSAEDFRSHGYQQGYGQGHNYRHGGSHSRWRGGRGQGFGQGYSERNRDYRK